MNGTYMLLFAGFHLVLGAVLFGFIAWFLMGDAGDVDESDGGGGLHAPRPWRPRPPSSRGGPLRRDAARAPRPRPRRRAPLS